MSVGNPLQRAIFFKTIFIVALALMFVPAPSKAGDLDSAKMNLEKVKVDLDNSTWDAFADDVKATETFLDGLPAADKDPVQKELDALKAKGATGFKDYKSRGIIDTAKRDLDSAAESIPNAPGTVRERLQQTMERLDSADAKAYADPEQIAKLKARTASLTAMANSKIIDFAAPIVKELDDAMAAQPFKDAKSNEEVDHVTAELTRLKSRINGALEGVPATDPRVVAIQAKLTAYDKTIAAASNSAGATQAADQLASYWKAQQEYFAGWEQEGQGPSWDEYTHHQNEQTGNLNLPKTIEVLRRVGPWLKEDSVKTAADQYKDSPTVKATLADAHKTFDTAAKKLDDAFNKIFADAEKLPVPKDEFTRSKAGYLTDSADNWLKGTTYHDADVARGKKLTDQWHNAVEGAEAAKQATATKMTADATAAWPGIASSMKADDNFTPDKLEQYKGKTIHLTGSNRCGWDYEPGAYRYARKINGMVVAGKYAPNVAAAVKTALSQTGQDLPDEDWDVYAVVEGPGKISERVSSEGKVKVDGQDVGTVTAEGHQTVDCTVVKIIAMHAGPVAVGPNGSSVSSAGGDGSATGAPMGGSTGASTGVLASSSAATAGAFSVFGLLKHLFELVLCVAAAGMIVMRAKPALAAQVSGGTTTVPMPGSETIGMAGLAFTTLGILWLLSKLIFGDLIPATFLILAGLCLSGDWLQAKGMFPASIGAKLKPLSLPIAGGTILFGLLHLFLFNSWLL